MAERLPQVISEGTLEAFGQTIRIYKLDDGRTIINAEDFDRLLNGYVSNDATKTDC